MARLYSKKKGKSGSTKPVKKTKPNWIRYDKKEIEQLIVKLSKTGKSSSEIGIILRDTYGVPDVKFLVGKKINKILQENNLQSKLPEDLMALIKKQIKITKHLEKNKQDKPALRGLQLTSSKINRLVSYYKNAGKLPKDWKYDKDKIGLLIQ
jgi:small subunit ribosomal protein S15